MAGSDVLLTGVPRSGTTLACYLLNRVPNTVALVEPLRAGRLAKSSDRSEIIGHLARFLRRSRRTLLTEGIALSKHVAGAIPDNTAESEPGPDGKRGSHVTLGEVRFEQPLDPDMTLVVKHTAPFAALLPDLTPRWPVVAIVRNPLATLASQLSIEFARRKRAGELPEAPPDAPAATRADIGVAHRLDQHLFDAWSRASDPIDQRIVTLTWFHEQFRRHLGDDRVIRYEDLIASRGAALAVAAPGAAQLEEPLSVRNTNPVYDREVMAELGERLLETDGALWTYYSRDDVAAVLHEVTRAEQAAP